VGAGLYAGLRRSEVIGLAVDAIDLQKRRIHVRRTYHVESRTLNEVRGKSEAARRTLPMVGPLHTILNERSGPRDPRRSTVHLVRRSTRCAAAIGRPSQSRDRPVAGRPRRVRQRSAAPGRRRIVARIGAGETNGIACRRLNRFARNVAGTIEDVRATRRPTAC
jgi:hypothetical protein